MSEQLNDRVQQQPTAANQTQLRADNDESTTRTEFNERKRSGCCVRWRSQHHLVVVTRLAEKWPRTFSLVFGVIIPLLMLIAISLFFGYGLAQLEAPSEIEANNALIANRALIALSGDFHNNVTVSLPTLCLNIFDQNKTDNLTIELEYAFDGLFDRVLHPLSSSSYNETTEGNYQEDAFDNSSKDEVSTSNDTSSGRLVSFMAECGMEGLRVANEFLQVVPLYVNDAVIANDISFNWIQCDGQNGTGSLSQQVWGRPFVNVTRLRPNAQEEVVITDWKRQQWEHYNDVLHGLGLVENDTQAVVETKLYAFQESLKTADGFTSCYPDSVSGAWFWFTIMTTIGYGTQVPVTQGGQAMVYTLGFLSILSFAFILAGAGTIVVTIVDDFVNRTRLSRINVDWVAMVFWGCCYYAWMLCIAAYTRSWKAERLGVDMEFSEAYWFSFISTTTVGLGDYILEQEVILRKDLFSFPLMFLAGFVLLSNFTVKLTDVLNNLVPSAPRKSLKDRLANSNVPCCGALRAPGRSKSTKSPEDTEDVMNMVDKTTVKSAAHSKADEEVETGVKIENDTEASAIAGSL